MMIRRFCLLLGLCFVVVSNAYSKPLSDSIAVLRFELNDLTQVDDNKQEKERVSSLKPRLEAALKKRFQYQLTTIEASQQAAADQGFGYLFEHPDAAAKLAKTVGTDWLVVGRLHKPSFLFAYLKVKLINVASGKAMPEIIVEIKGQQAVVTEKGIQQLATKIDSQIKNYK